MSVQSARSEPPPAERKAAAPPAGRGRRLGVNAVAGGVANFLKIGVQLVMLPLMAHLLGPSEFGLYALALPTISFVMILADGGLAASLAREPGEATIVWSTAFWLTLLVGVTLASIVIGWGFVLGALSHESRVSGLMALLSPSLIMIAGSALPSARLTRQGRLVVFAAAEDISYYARNDCGHYGAKTRAYFAGLGIDGSRGYLNSGLLLARREAWRSIIADAIRYFEEHSDKCSYHDQSALNAVVGDRRTRLSPLWNFQTPFCYWGIYEDAEPRIFHFTEFPKPWMGDVSPWRFLHDAIREALAEFSDLKLPAQKLSAEEVQKYDRQRNERARRLSSRMPIRLMLRRREFDRLMEQAAL